MTALVEEALAEIAAARAEVAAAFETILDNGERGLARLRSRRGGLEPLLHAMILACAADDIVGQRLSRAQRLLKGEASVPLLRGPAFSGEGLGQASADALFTSDEPTSPP